MAPYKFSAPKEWEEWQSIGFGVWLLVAPWVLPFSDNGAVQNSVIVGLLIIAAEVFTFSSVAVLEVLVDFALGVWLVLCPWVLGINSKQGTYHFVITGVLVVALACYELWRGNRNTLSGK